MQEAETRSLGIDQKRELQGNQNTAETTAKPKQASENMQKKADREHRNAVYNPEKKKPDREIA